MKKTESVNMWSVLTISVILYLYRSVIKCVLCNVLASNGKVIKIQNKIARLFILTIVNIFRSPDSPDSGDLLS